MVTMTFLRNVAIAGACGLMAMPIVGLLTGRADHRSTMGYGTGPLRAPSARDGDTAWLDDGPVRDWRVGRLPSGGVAAVSLNENGRLVALMDLDHDRRHFTLVSKDGPCATLARRPVAATLFTTVGDERDRRVWTPGPMRWFDRQAEGGGERVRATMAAMVEWMMHVVPGERRRLRVADAPGGPNAVDLVLGRTADERGDRSAKPQPH
jgi:hypothetical protein